jgi:hypothetical protein
MRNTFLAQRPVYNWVNNVYSLCVEPGVTWVRLYTTSHLQPITTTTKRAKPLLFTHFIGFFTQGSYTAFFSNFNLLNTRLYTLSTIPINTKTKEKIRKEH